MPVNWRKIDRTLCEVYGLTPQAIDQMTLAEIGLLLEDSQAMAKRGDMSDAQIKEELRRWRGMTNLQKLQEAKANG